MPDRRRDLGDALEAFCGRRSALAAALLAVALPCCGGPDPDLSARPSERPSDSGSRAAAVPPPPDPRDGRPVIVAFGDSLTAGYGIEVAEAWPARLQEWLDAEGFVYRVVNSGVSGETSAGGLRRLSWVLDREPDAALVVIALGGNDGLRGTPPDAMADNLRGMIEQAAARGLGVLLAGVPSPPELGADYEEAFARVFPEVAAETGAALLPDLLEGVAGDPELNQDDRIHPNPEGARRLAATVSRALRPLLGEPTGPRGVTAPEGNDAPGNTSEGPSR